MDLSQCWFMMGQMDLSVNHKDAHEKNVDYAIMVQYGVWSKLMIPCMFGYFVWDVHLLAYQGPRVLILSDPDVVKMDGWVLKNTNQQT